MTTPASDNNLPRSDPAGVQGELFEGSAALDPFFEHLPDKPYCADDPRHGLTVLPRRAALRRRLIQHQPPWLRVHLTFDIDRDGAWCAADEAKLPAPTWVAINRQNGHGHAVYSLDAPVLLGPRDRDGPIRFLVQVERALRVRLGADASYGGFTTKNPVHRHWVTIAAGQTYELDELREYLGDLRKYATVEPEAVGIGRNVEAFDAVRQLSYRCIREFCGEVVAYTAERHDPALHDQECRWIAGSVARWTWRRFTPAGFRAIQRRRGVKGGKASGVARREAIADRDRAIIAYRASGMTLRAIAESCGVSVGTVHGVCKAECSTKPYQVEARPGAVDRGSSQGARSVNPQPAGPAFPLHRAKRTVSFEVDDGFPAPSLQGDSVPPDPPPATPPPRPTSMLSEPAKTPAADRSGKGKRTGKRKPEAPKVDTDDPAWLTDTSGDLFRPPAEPAA